MSQDLAYHYGVFLGDGFIERYSAESTCWYVGLKSIDREFVEHWQTVLERLTGKRYAIRAEPAQKANHNPRYRCRCGRGDFARLTIEATDHKRKIPEAVLGGTPEEKRAFLQGLMDSEGWVTCTLKSLGLSSIVLSFGLTSEWCPQILEMFRGLGIATSDMRVRKGWHDRPAPSKKPERDLLSFDIDILQYMDAGLGFNIKRKQDRLDYCARILRDYTRDYPRYSAYFGQKIESGR